MQQNQKLNGFTVTRVRENSEINGTMVEMKHDRTGAQVCWLDNGLSNKLFSITFKTLPVDDTGVFHILEHSTLCGSKKYPVREPFVELLKSSMNTFLNAFTAGDFTSYPVSSRNEQDYLNLTGVYLDAVFAPRLLEDANIFRQEGWHIEMNDGVPSYKGVVFNEMKGAMSGVDRLIGQELETMMFPDNCYCHNSGGEPTAIPQLTYEQFIATYRKFYHPSNARVFLDGAVPVEKVLALLDEYFSAYDRRDDFPVLAPQTPVSAEKTVYYELGQDEDTANKAYAAMGKIICLGSERVKALAAQVVMNAVMGTNEAPLKRALLSAGLAENFEAEVDPSGLQAYCSLVAKNLQDGREADMFALIGETVKKLIADGLDRDELTAAINRIEFEYKEPQEPAGLVHGMMALSAWLYDGDPMEPLVSHAVIEELRALLKTDYYEKLLAEMLLDETGRAVLHALPSKTLGEEKRQDEAERLNKIVAQWTDADKAANKAQNESLTAWQQTEDTPEQLATLPMLSLADVSDKPDMMPTNFMTENGVKVMYHPAACPGIVNFTLMFTLADFTLEEMTQLALADSLLGRLPTKRHSALEIQRLLTMYTGHADFSVKVFGIKGNDGECQPKLTVHCSALTENAVKAQELILEILTETQFGDKDKLREIIVQEAIAAKQREIMAGHRSAFLAASASFSARAAVSEAIGGHTQFTFIQNFAAAFDAQADGFIALFERMMSASVCKKRLLMSQTAQTYTAMDTLTAALPEGTDAPARAAYVTAVPKKGCVTIPAQIGFASKCFNVRKAGMNYSGAFDVAAQILSLNYLWNRVRVQGGAYGCGIQTGTSGQIMTYSFRDPTPARTLGVYDEMADYLRTFAEENPKIDKFIISTIAGNDPLMTPDAQGMRADADNIAGYGWDDMLRAHREALHAGKQDLLDFAAALDAFKADGGVCVVAHEAALKDCGGLKAF